MFIKNYNIFKHERAQAHFFFFFSSFSNSLDSLDSWLCCHNRLFFFQQVRKVVQQFFASAPISSRPLDPHIWTAPGSNHFQSNIGLQRSPFHFLVPQLQSCFGQT